MTTNITEVDSVTYTMQHEEDGTIKLVPVKPEAEMIKCGDVFTGDFIGNGFTVHGKSESFGSRGGCGVHSPVPGPSRELQFNIFDVLNGSLKRAIIKEYQDELIETMKLEDTDGDSILELLYRFYTDVDIGDNYRAPEVLAKLGLTK